MTQCAPIRTPVHSCIPPAFDPLFFQQWLSNFHPRRTSIFRIPRLLYPLPRNTLGSRYPSRRFHRSSLQSRSKFATLSSSFPANKRGMRAAGREERASVANVAAIRIPSLTRSSKSPSPSVVVDHDALLYPLPFRGGCV